jgi:hypothetical protein
MIYTYRTMLLRIPTHGHVFLPTKLHLVSAAQAPSWQVQSFFDHQKLKCSILCRTNLNIFTAYQTLLFLKPNLNQAYFTNIKSQIKRMQVIERNLNSEACKNKMRTNLFFELRVPVTQIEVINT